MTTITITVSVELIRPWYPSGLLGHIYPDCPELLRWEADPREGPGWLDPTKGPICEPCVRRYDRDLAALLFGWDAECATCGWNATDDQSHPAPALTKSEAQEWFDGHECRPELHMIPPPSPPTAPPDLVPLFDLEAA